MKEPISYPKAKPGYQKKCPSCQQFCHNPAKKCANCGHNFVTQTKEPETQPSVQPKPAIPVINYGSRQVTDWRMVTMGIRSFVAMAGGIEEAKRLLDEAKRLGIIS